MRTRGLVALLIIEVREDRLHHLLDNLVRGPKLSAPNSWLAVDAHADFHLILAEIERGLSDLGDDARREGDAHGPHAGDRLVGEPLHLGEVFSGIGRCARDLVDEENPSHAAALVFLSLRSRRDIVHTDDLGDFDVFHFGHLLGHVEVNFIAGIVAVDVENALPFVYGLGDLEHLLGRGGLKNAADGATVEQSVANVTHEKR